MPLRYLPVLAISALLASIPGFGQRYNFENYSVNEGLPNNVVRSIAQDELGFMYFGTNNGLAVYDGSVFSSFPLPGTGSGQQVFRMKNIGPRRLWVDYSGNRELLWVSKGVLANAGIRNKHDINNYYELDGQTYLCTDWGFFRLENDELEQVQLGMRNDDRVIHFLFPAGDGKYIVARKGFSMALVEGKTFEKLDETAEDISVNDIRVGPDGHFWIATDSHGLLLLDGTALRTGRIRFLPQPASLSFLGKEDIFCIAFNKDDQSLLLGTSHYGILNYHRNGVVTRMNRNNGLSGNKVNCMFLDRDKTWWIGTDFGVDKLANTSFMFYGTEDGTALGSTFRVEKDSSGRTWFFGNECFYYTENETAVRAEYPPGVEKIALASSSTRNGIWVSVPNHLFFIDTRSSRPVIGKPIYTSDTYRRMTKWNDCVMLGGKYGLAVLEQGKVRMVDDSFVDIRALCTDRFNKLWVGTFSHGLFRLDLSKNAGGLKAGRMQQILDSNSNYNRFLALMCDGRGRIWAGTRFHGVYVYDLSETSAVKKYQLGMTEGLSNNWITSVTQVPGGDVWIGTNTGFDRYSEQGGKSQVVRLSRQYRFNNSVHQLMGDKDCLWAATDVGAIRISFVKERYYQFPTYFKEVSFPDSVRQIFSTDTTLLLRPDENSFSVSFTAPFYINEQQTEYFYRLVHDGSHADWIEVRANHSINFNSLRSGKYVLELRSIPFNGQTGYLVSRLGFVIATPFYQSTWFILLLSLAGVCLVYLFYRYRIRELKKLYMVRDNISRNLHDEIGATLSSINIYSDVARHKVDDTNEVKPLLDRIYNGSGQVMENMNDIVWYVNPKNDSWEDILVRMREFAIPILEARNVDVLFTADEKLLGHKLSMLQRQNIYYIFKEAVNNAAKYSGAGKVEISLTRTGSTLLLTVADNGKGFCNETVKKGNGLFNMQKRAEALNGSLTIDSEPGKGSSVRFALQIP